MIRKDVLASPEYAAYVAQYPGKKESVYWMFWDTVAYLSAATVQLVFFNATRANVTLSNMQLAGQLPQPQAFFLRQILFNVLQRPQSIARAAAGQLQPGAIDNIQQLLNTGTMQFLIGAKNYGPYPLWKLAAGGGAYGGIASDGDVADPGEVQDWAIPGAPDVRNGFSLAIPILLAPQVNFQFTLTWPAAITLAGGNTNLVVALEGDLIRQVQ